MKNYLILLIITFSDSSNIFAQIPDYNYLQMKKTSDSFLYAGKFDLAFSGYKKMMRDKNSNARDCYRGAYCAYKLNKYKSAEQFLNQALKRGHLFFSENSVNNDVLLKNGTPFHKKFNLEFRKNCIKNIFIADTSLLSLFVCRKKYSDSLKFGLQDYEAIRKIDSLDQCWLEKIVEQNGWPGYNKIGIEGDNIAWSIVQLSEKNTNFQSKILPKIEKELKKYNTDFRLYAHLIDRMYYNAGKKQIFGTQFEILKTDTSLKVVPRPVENEFYLNTLRDYMGLEPEADYINYATEKYKKEYGLKREYIREQNWLLAFGCLQLAFAIFTFLSFLIIHFSFFIFHFPQ